MPVPPAARSRDGGAWKHCGSRATAETRGSGYAGLLEEAPTRSQSVVGPVVNNRRALLVITERHVRVPFLSLWFAHARLTSLASGAEQPSRSVPKSESFCTKGIELVVYRGRLTGSAWVRSLRRRRHNSNQPPTHRRRDELAAGRHGADFEAYTTETRLHDLDRGAVLMSPRFGVELGAGCAPRRPRARVVADVPPPTGRASRVGAIDVRGADDAPCAAHRPCARGAKRPKSSSIRGPLGHKRLAGAYVRFVAGDRGLSGVLHPLVVRRAGTAQALHPDRQQPR